ncbi:MAG TPA: hypothetical protein VFN95_18975, partial [Flavitalea sp.]|nr:hypothetical protein [Flavitalea sp.]
MIFSGDLDGSLNDFSLNRLKINTKDLQFAGNTNVNLDQVNYRVEIDQLKVQKKLLSRSFLLELEKQNIYLPEYIDASGHVNGTDNKVIADLKLNSNYGTMQIVGDAGNFNRLENLQYNVNLDAVELETGKWIGMDSVFGKISGQVIAKGSGIDPAKMNSSAEFKINSFVLNGYNYSNVDIKARLAESAFTAVGSIKDSNLIANLDLHGNVSGNYPSIKGIVDLRKIDLNQLGFTEDSIILTTHLNIDAPATDPKQLDVSVFADSSLLVINGKSTRSDSVWITAKSSVDNSEVGLHSRLLVVNLNTNYSLNLLGDEIENIVDRINPLNDSFPEITHNNHVTSFNATLNKHELVNTLVPGLELKDPIIIEGKYNAAETDSFLLFNTNAASFSYNNIQFDQLKIQANNNQDTIQLSATVNSIHSRDTIYNPSINAHWHSNMITVAGLIQDKKGKTDYSLKTSIQAGNKTTTITVLEDPTLHYRKWEVSPDNMVQIRNDGYIFRNFSLVNNRQSLHINSVDSQTISPIEIRIDSFEIGEILALASFNDTTLARGSLSAAINIQQPIEKFPDFTGTLGIQNLAIQEILVGDFELQSRSVSEKLELSGAVKGNTDLNFSGNIDPGKGNLDLNARIQKLDMKLV